MGKKEASQSMEQFLAKVDQHINVEPHLDAKVVETDGFFRKAVITTDLWEFIKANAFINKAAVPKKILAKAVAEILLNLKEGRNSSTFTDPEDGKPVEVDLSAIAGVFNLPKEGADSLLDLELSVAVEFACFATDKDDEFDPKHSNIRTDLKTPFNYICELFSKSVLCSIGSQGQIFDTKLFAVKVIVDSLTGTKFNWHGWFFNQIYEVSKDFKFVEGSTNQILRKGKLRFFSRISYTLEKLFPNRRWTNTMDYKKNTIFNDIYKTEKVAIDSGIFEVDVLPAIPVAERESRKKKS